MKAHGRGGGRDPLVLISTRYESEWSASLPGLFTVEKDLRYTLNRRPCVLQGISGSFEKSLDSAGSRTPVSVDTALFRLLILSF